VQHLSWSYLICTVNRITGPTTRKRVFTVGFGFQRGMRFVSILQWLLRYTKKKRYAKSVLYSPAELVVYDAEALIKSPRQKTIQRGAIFYSAC
jgi:hypothetical protein